MAEDYQQMLDTVNELVWPLLVQTGDGADCAEIVSRRLRDYGFQRREGDELTTLTYLGPEIKIGYNSEGEVPFTTSIRNGGADEAEGVLSGLIELLEDI